MYMYMGAHISLQMEAAHQPEQRIDIVYSNRNDRCKAKMSSIHKFLNIKT
jgi:hypothetical protein